MISASHAESREEYQQRQDDAGRHVNQPTIGAIALGTGAVLMAAGLLWHFLEPTGPKSSARVHFTPSGVAGTF